MESLRVPSGSAEHRQAFVSLAANVLKWLDEESPMYWRRAWLWVMRADLGDPADLVEGPSRDWRSIGSFQDTRSIRWSTS